MVMLFAFSCIGRAIDAARTSVVAATLKGLIFMSFIGLFLV